MVTFWFLVFIAVILIAYDVLAPYIGQPTESRVLRSLSHDWTILPAVMGVLVGHWVGPGVSVGVSGWGYALAAVSPILVVDIVWNVKRMEWHWARSPLIYVLAGTVLGTLLWSQG